MDSKELIVQIVDHFKAPFLLVHTCQSETGRKEYEGFRNGYTNFSYDESLSVAREVKFDLNQIFFRCPQDLIVFDTDTEESYNMLKEFLKDRRLYNRACVTKSFNAIMNRELKYKGRFFFIYQKIAQDSLINSMVGLA